MGLWVCALKPFMGKYKSNLNNQHLKNDRRWRPNIKKTRLKEENLRLAI